MLSIISVPRATTGLFNVTQRNAIRSWRRSIPECEILLCGNEVGIESLADEVAGHVIKEIKVNDRERHFLTPFWMKLRDVHHIPLCFMSTQTSF